MTWLTGFKIEYKSEKRSNIPWKNIAGGPLSDLICSISTFLLRLRDGCEVLWFACLSVCLYLLIYVCTSVRLHIAKPRV